MIYFWFGFCFLSFLFFFFNDTATTEIYTLSLHDALPIFWGAASLMRIAPKVMGFGCRSRIPQRSFVGFSARTRLPNVRSVSILRISFYCLLCSPRTAWPPPRDDLRLGRLLGVLGHELHIQRQALQLFHQHVEGLRRAWLEEIFSLHDGFVDPVATLDVVRLDGEHFLQRVGGAVRFERPHLHFTEALAAELRLAAQGLLRDQ